MTVKIRELKIKADFTRSVETIAALEEEKAGASSSSPQADSLAESVKAVANSIKKRRER